MTRPTRRGAALLGVALVTYLAARVLGTWELYLMALAFAGMTVVAWVLVAVGARRLAVIRDVSPEQPLAGDLLELTFTVDTGWRLPGLYVVLLNATGDIPGLPRDVVVDDAGLPGRGRVTAGPSPARRGVHRLPGFAAAVEDPLGLVRARRACGEPLRLTVAPRLEELASCAPCADSGARHGGGRRRLPTRDAWEFRGIRPHVPGEPLNRVDWKSTAKIGSLMLREMEADSEDDLTVLLNGPPARPGAAHAGGSEQPDEAFEAAVVAAGSMAAFTLRTGHAVSLLLPDDGWRDLRLTPDAASGRRLLTALAEAEPQGLLRLGSSLPAILGTRSHDRRRVVTLVTTLVDDDLVNALGRLRRQGVAVSVVHVLGGSDAGGSTAGGGPVAALAAAGVRYFPLPAGAGVRTALATRTSDRMVRAR